MEDRKVKVFVVLYGYDYDGDECIGAASTLEGAKALAEQHAASGSDLPPLTWKHRPKAHVARPGTDWKCSGYPMQWTITEHEVK